MVCRIFLRRTSVRLYEIKYCGLRLLSVVCCLLSVDIKNKNYE